MKNLWIRAAPPNSLILVEDSSGGEVPLSMNESLTSFTSTCLAIGCLSDMDGETNIGIGYFDYLDEGVNLAFSGSLETPNLKIAINAVFGLRLLETKFKQIKTQIEVWVNHSIEPDRIIVRLI